MGWWKNSSVVNYLIERYGFNEPDAMQVGRALNKCRTLPGTNISLKKFDTSEIAAWMAALQLGPGGYLEGDASSKLIVEMTINQDYQAGKIDSFALQLLVELLTQFDEVDDFTPQQPGNKNIDELVADTVDSITEIINQSASKEEFWFTSTGEQIPHLAAALLWQMSADLWMGLSDFNADVYDAGFEEPACKDEIDFLCYQGTDEYSEDGRETLQITVFN